MSAETAQSKDKEKVSRIFNADTGGDIVFRSSDNVLFYIHQKNLEVLSEGFPPTSHTSTSLTEIVPLTETSSTLELLFQYTYHQMPPDLDNLNFQDLMNLAEAAEKYVIHYARKSCLTQIKKFIPKYPLRILSFSGEHGHEELIYEVAPQLMTLPLSKIVYTIPPGLYIPWSLCHDQLISEVPLELATSIFKEAEKLECDSFSEHDAYWHRKIRLWKKQILDERCPRSQVETLLNSVDPAYLKNIRCCTKFLMWRHATKDVTAEHIKDLRYFVEKHKSIMGWKNLNQGTN
ncbi:hypothetical protein K435DRAFT_769590 [Dendrothele bispora CBS 962.96]|uniref:BTB domain-containing protein n=1 Tax=Dendrothele bispora (strain CBS 962.96) TaxID=1314807 RepID=A0A4V4HB64_DENBC|nr:hypothetical protein K435DRAFT_769590 [Dendrothele bispora CBS 962.96]